MKKISSYVFLRVVMALCFFCTPVFAYAAICNSFVPFQSITGNVDTTIYAGEDIPVGTILYTLNYQLKDSSHRFSCNADTSITQEYKVSSTPMGSSFGFSGNPFTGNIFKTNVDGIGVAITLDGKTGRATLTENNAIKTTWPAPGYPPSTQNISTMNAYYHLVKIGPVASGATVLGSSFPSYKGDIFSNAEPTRHPVFTGEGGVFNGSIHILSSTCQALDKSVEIGDFKGDDIPKKGSTTPWVDSSIELINCPDFLGYYNNTHQTTQNGATASGGTITSNKVSVSLTPSYGTVDSTKGLIDIDKSKANSAEGIAIQIGYGDVSNPAIWNLASSQTYTMSSNAGSSIRFPMVARYYRTEDKIQGGVADSKLIYTITYN